MNDMDKQLVIRALNLLGKRLGEAVNHNHQVEIILIGGVAGMLSGELQADRTTMDCDVLAISPKDNWELIQKTAHRVADQLGLSPSWLNNKARIFAYMLPLGWRKRLHEIPGQFGSCRLQRVDRLDLICMKIFGAIKRPVDREDLSFMKPTQEELNFAEENLNRLQSESLFGEDYQQERTFINILRTRTP